MACYHPLQAWSLKGKRKPDGKRIISFNGPTRGDDPDKWEEIQLPCGQCIGCRLDYSREWADRIMLESTLWENSWFVTLTYSEEFVPIKQVINKETGELIEGKTLVPEHLTKFMKDLRRYYKYHYDQVNIRFYACGEYGGQTERPHYHLCVFNLPLFDLEPFFLNAQHDQIYKCATIEKIWGKGIISVGKLTWNSAAYVARYMLKKQKGDGASWYYQSKGQLPEFTRMSRRPGIGAMYYEGHKEDIYKNDEIVVLMGKRPRAVKPPKYFDRLYDLESPEAMAAIKEARGEAARRKEAAADKQSTLYPWERLEIQERAKKEQIKKLVRTIEV